jgi:CxxC motif-containing protein
MNIKTVRTKMICTICPLGCELEAEIQKEGNGIMNIKGFKCPKGKEYATREITDPRRVLMAVVKVKGGHLPAVSVKTAKPIPKHVLFDAVRVISNIEVEAPIKAGDVIVSDIIGTGVPVVATNNIKKS